MEETNARVMTEWRLSDAARQLVVRQQGDGPVLPFEAMDPSRPLVINLGDTRRTYTVVECQRFDVHGMDAALQLIRGHKELFGDAMEKVNCVRKWDPEVHTAIRSVLNELVNALTHRWVIRPGFRQTQELSDTAELTRWSAAMPRETEELACDILAMFWLTDVEAYMGIARRLIFSTHILDTAGIPAERLVAMRRAVSALLFKEGSLIVGLQDDVYPICPSAAMRFCLLFRALSSICDALGIDVWSPQCSPRLDQLGSDALYNAAVEHPAELDTTDCLSTSCRALTCLAKFTVVAFAETVEELQTFPAKPTDESIMLCSRRTLEMISRCQVYNIGFTHAAERISDYGWLTTNGALLHVWDNLTSQVRLAPLSCVWFANVVLGPAGWDPRSVFAHCSSRVEIATGHECAAWSLATFTSFRALCIWETGPQSQGQDQQNQNQEEPAQEPELVEE